MMRHIKPPTFAELYAPKLITVLREGYGVADFRADVTAGLTVAIVALPLSMAIAIACGVTPDRGLYTAVIGGFIVSLLGGSRFQIGGPAGAFIVLVAATVQEHDPDIARSALDNYEPAEPLSVGALTAGGLAALWGWAATRLIAWPFSRRRRLRVARP
jgi:MFS superfamily sulfate permease-like transporter